VIVWLKVLHIASLVFWCAGLLYLPGLLAAHPGTTDPEAFRRLRAMSRLTYVYVTSPAAVIAVASGTALIWAAEAHGGWLALKLTAVALMVVFHVYCGRVLALLHDRPRLRRPATHASLAVAPVLLIPTVLWLVLGKPI
jgi:protoporphyrinogen IX oxidase